MSESSEQTIIFDNVSKFYGEILGVNRVSLAIPPGITSLVGPNGAGKSTLMNLMTGLLKPTRGKVTVLGISTDQPEELFRRVGYCSQFDSFPRGLTGREFIRSVLLLSGYSKGEADHWTTKALERVDLGSPADGIRVIEEKVAKVYGVLGASDRFRNVLYVDVGHTVTPSMRAETIALFKQLAAEGLHLIISSHILHEVDMMSDRVVLLNNGYVVAEGAIHGVRDEMDVEHPMQILIRCDQPALLAARMFQSDHVVEARVHDDRQGLFVKTRNPDQFYLLLNDVVAQGQVNVESIAPVDDDLSAVYEYLIGSQ